MRVRVAGFWRRLAAGIVDVMVLASVFGILATLVAVVLRHPLPRMGQIGPDYVVDMAVNGGLFAEAGLAMLAILGFCTSSCSRRCAGRRSASTSCASR